MNKQDAIAIISALAVTKHPPKTQYDGCLIAARISIACGDIPQSDEEFLSAAHGLAAGLFGEAFEAANYGQKTAWIDMCERALREASGSAPVSEKRKARA